MTFISQQVRVNVGYFLRHVRRREEFECNARIIRIELEDGTEIRFFWGGRVLIRITRVCAYRTLKITPFHGRLRGERCASRVMRKV